jgi:replicative DNA helicase
MARAPRQAEGGAAPGRVPPHDLDAERSVLSALLLDPRAFHDVSLEVGIDDFYHPAHQTLYRNMLAIHEEGRPVDLITLSEQLNSRKQLDQIGAVATAGFEPDAR